MNAPTQKKAQATIRCTAENANEFRAMVQRWPELGALVKGLQQHGIFPGLRGMQITLTGSESYVAKGVGAVKAENAPGGLNG